MNEDCVESLRIVFVSALEHLRQADAALAEVAIGDAAGSIATEPPDVSSIAEYELRRLARVVRTDVLRDGLELLGRAAGE